MLSSSSSCCLSSGFMSSRLASRYADAQRIVERGDQRPDVGREAVASDSARSTSSCSRRTCASISSDRCEGSGSGLIERRQDAFFGLQELGARARDAFDEDAHAALALRHLADDRHRPDPVEIVGRRLVVVVLLQQQEHHAVAGERPVDRLDRHRPADAERRDRHRQHDRAAKRDDRQFVGQWGSLGRFSHQVSSCDGSGPSATIQAARAASLVTRVSLPKSIRAVSSSGVW